MKRLTLLFIVSLFSLIGLAVPAAHAVERWKFQMYDPAVTTDQKINIEYKVMSIMPSDTFTMRLYRDGVLKGQRNTTSDSGVFTVNLPDSGTYDYKVTATNEAVSETREASRTVVVEDDPEPTVRTITVQTAQPVAQPAGGAEAAAAPGDGAAVAQAPAPGEEEAAVGQDGAGDEQDAGAADDQEAAEGQTTPEAQATDEGTEEGDVLGQEAERAADSSNTAWWVALLAVVVAGVGYGVYRFRPKL